MKTAPIRRTSRALSDKPENVRRREKYIRDRDYRATARKRALSYAKVTRTGNRELLLALVCQHPYNKRMIERVRSAALRDYGRPRFHRASKEPVLCLSASEMSAVIERPRGTFLEWITRKAVPGGDVLVQPAKGRPFTAYTVPHARRVLLAVLHVVHGPAGHIVPRHIEAIRRRFVSNN